MPIPERVIQTGPVRPTVEEGSAAPMCRLDPRFEYRFFDDADVDAFVRESFPEHHALFRGLRFPIQRFDFFRYLVVFRLGGFYFDLDLALTGSLAKLVSTPCVFPFEKLTIFEPVRRRGMDWQIGNYAFGAEPGHPFLEAVIDGCIRAHREPDWAEVPRMRFASLEKSFFTYMTTGPGLVSRVYADNPELAAAVTILFPDDVCDPHKWNRFGNVGRHRPQGSWKQRAGLAARIWLLLANYRAIRSGRRLGRRRA